MNEEWRDIAGYEGYYQVSNIGEVKSVRSGIILKPMDPGRYHHLVVELNKKGVRKVIYIHKLVLETFVSLRPDGLVCCHNDGDLTNNRVENLRWDTQKNNVSDSIRHGTIQRGETHYMAKLKNEDVIKIRELLNDGELLQHEIAELFGVKKVTISNIKNNKVWKHLH